MGNILKTDAEQVEYEQQIKNKNSEINSLEREYEQKVQAALRVFARTGEIPKGLRDQINDLLSQVKEAEDELRAM